MFIITLTIWKITMFLSHMDKLPPAVQEYWKTSFGTGPEPEKKEGMKDLSHEKGSEKKDHDKDHH
jgi:hypothetical protein